MRVEKNDEYAYLKQILENSPDGVFTVDMALTIRYVNPAFCRILGYSAEEILGSQITDYLGDLGILEVCSKEVQRTGHCNDQETIFKRADGTMVHVSKSVQAILDETINIRENLVTIRDLTAIHHMNRRLEQSLTEREQANLVLQNTLDTLRETQSQLVHAEKMAALGGLVAGVAHEINTPVGIGFTAASHLDEKVKALAARYQTGAISREDLTAFIATASEATTMVLSNLQRAADLIRSFKQVAVDQSGGHQRHFYLKDYLQAVLHSLSPQLGQTSHKVQLECPEKFKLYCKPGDFSQFITNLVMNSLIHGFEGIEKGHILIQVSEQHEGLLLRYADDGRGIAAEHLARIFDPFYTTKRGQGGSGLGLHVTYNIITQGLGGSINCRSTPGQGVVFDIRIPGSVLSSANPSQV